MLRELQDDHRLSMEAAVHEDPLAVLVAHVLVRDTDAADDVAAALGNDLLLKAGRAYFALLTENDRLPIGNQLTETELALPRNLLLDFFTGGDSVQARAQEVLGLVERKFADRAFQQATILLQLFETDPAIRLQNERKLFYEDMIQRLGVRRRDPLSHDQIQVIREHFGEIGRALRTDGAFETPAEDEVFGADDALSQTLDEVVQVEAVSDPFVPLLKSLDWLAQEQGLQFCVLTREPEEMAAWAASSLGGDAALAGQMAQVVPPLRWRSAADSGRPMLTVLRDHVSGRALREYVRTLTKAVYFILLAVGDTGLEGYLDSYFDWASEVLEVDATAFIDRLHRESTLGEKTLNETLDSIFDEYFAARVDREVMAITGPRLTGAVEALVTQFETADMGEVAPGHFDLGGFLLDHLMGLRLPTPEFAFRLHRIS
jgi:hypothetical protein